MKNIKTLSMYLPQFHRVEENDEWWGEGFTEWTTVRGATSLFEGHKQPIRPLHGNYYNLMEKATMEWQASLMKKYGIDGQCFYHYYFKDGRQILEKPAENLLEWKDIDMPFCFCWANQTWARTWSNLRGNSWADKYEKKGTTGDDGILIEQRYGREKEWEAHFAYLLPFFKDERYIKLNGAPVFIFFAPLTIPCLPQMIDYWNELAVKNGFERIYFIGMKSNRRIYGLDALTLFSPHMVWELEKPVGGIQMIDYDRIWENIRKAEPIQGCKTYYCGVSNIDDTPRRERSNGVVLKNFSIEKFFEGMCMIYQKSAAAGNEFVFINAWNEWGEGMQLEPDEEYGYAKLEAVYKAKEHVLRNAEICKEAQVLKPDQKHLGEGENKTDYLSTAKCFDQWMSLREKNISLADYLNKYEVTHVAVYGYGMLGRHLISELERTGIVIDYIIDKSSRRNSLKYDVRNMEDNLPVTEAVIITIVDEFDRIYSVLKKRLNCKFFSLSEIVEELS